MINITSSNNSGGYEGGQDVDEMIHMVLIWTILILLLIILALVMLFSLNLIHQVKNRIDTIRISRFLQAEVRGKKLNITSNI